MELSECFSGKHCETYPQQNVLLGKYSCNVFLEVHSLLSHFSHEAMTVKYIIAYININGPTWLVNMKGG